MLNQYSYKRRWVSNHTTIAAACKNTKWFPRDAFLYDFMHELMRTYIFPIEKSISARSGSNPRPLDRRSRYLSLGQHGSTTCQKQSKLVFTLNSVSLRAAFACICIMCFSSAWFATSGAWCTFSKNIARRQNSSVLSPRSRSDGSILTMSHATLNGISRRASSRSLKYKSWHSLLLHSLNLAVILRKQNWDGCVTYFSSFYPA